MAEEEVIKGGEGEVPDEALAEMQALVEKTGFLINPMREVRFTNREGSLFLGATMGLLPTLFSDVMSGTISRQERISSVVYHYFQMHNGFLEAIYHLMDTFSEFCRMNKDLLRAECFSLTGGNGDEKLAEFSVMYEWEMFHFLRASKVRCYDQTSLPSDMKRREAQGFNDSVHSDGYIEPMELTIVTDADGVERRAAKK